MRLFEALPLIRGSKFNLPLTYDAAKLELHVGDIVRVPLGPREVLALVVSPIRDATPVPKIRAVLEKSDAPRAFTETGLQLAQFIAERYICTLGEALGAVVLATAIPRMVDSLERIGEQPAAADSATV